MLSRLYSRPLYFPKISYLGDAPIRHKTVPLYLLNWDGQEHKIIAAWEAELAASRGFYESDPEWAKGRMELKWYLPEPYLTMIKEARFAMTPAYLTGVQRMSKYAMEIWNDSWPYDTNIRELCLTPTVKAVWCAFTLLQDCLYNEEHAYYERSVARREIILASMVHRFWNHQTGSGLIWDHAELDRVVEMSKNPAIPVEDQQELKKFVRAVSATTVRISS